MHFIKDIVLHRRAAYNNTLHLFHDMAYLLRLCPKPSRVAVTGPGSTSQASHNMCMSHHKSKHFSLSLKSTTSIYKSPASDTRTGERLRCTCRHDSTAPYVVDMIHNISHPFHIKIIQYHTITMDILQAQINRSLHCMQAKLHKEWKNTST